MFFNAVRQNKEDISTTFSDVTLLNWLQKYVQAVCPDNGIDWWSHGQATYELKKSPLVSDKDFHHVAVYVTSGSNEGEIIRVNLMKKDGGIQEIGYAKSFGPSEQNWQIAMAINKALESLYFYGSTPVITELMAKLPVKSCYDNYSNTVLVYHDETRLKLIVKETGDVLDQYDFHELGSDAKFKIQPLLADWVSLLTKFNVKHEDVTLEKAALEQVLIESPEQEMGRASLS